MNMRTVFSFMLAILILTACNNKKSKEDYKEIINYTIEQVNQSIEKGILDTALFITAGNAYSNYIERFPEDSLLLPAYYFEAAKYYLQGGDFDKSLALIDTFRVKYPKHKLAPASLHFKAYYIYENGKYDLVKARQAYEEFLQKYPANNDFTEAILFSLDNLGKSDEQILNEILEKNKSNQTDSLNH
jgi:outer membrane protein assembly factor BamD (BamD/ComL family)